MSDFIAIFGFWITVVCFAGCCDFFGATAGRVSVLSRTGLNVVPFAADVAREDVVPVAD